MNTKLAVRILFLMAVLLLLVIMGMNNRQRVDLSIPPLPKQKLPAALMYYGFFGVGVACGAMITAGKKSGGASKSKSGK